MLFRKPFPQGARNLVGSKDRKRLRQSVLTSFSQDGCTENDLDTVLLPKNEDITVQKIQGSKLQIYFVRGEPLFFETDHHVIVPTLFALRRVPSLVSCFLIHPPVSRFLLKGADLMLPGVIRPSPHGLLACYGKEGLFSNKIMAVRVAGNPIPFAVGLCCVDRTASLVHGKGGKVLEILHIYGDYLWELGHALSAGNATGIASYPNFSTQVIDALDPPAPENPEYYPDLASAWEGVSAGSPRSSQSPPSQLGNATDGLQGSAASHSNASQLGAKQVDTTAAVGTARPMESPEKSPELANPSTTGAPAPPAVPGTVMDALLELVLLEVLHTSIVESALPLNVSGVYSQMAQVAGVMQFHPKFVQYLNAQPDLEPLTAEITQGRCLVGCDIKRSTHKKFAKFFQYYSKKKLLQIKDVRGETLLIGINRQAPLYRSYTPLSDKEKKYAQAKVTGPQGCDGASSDHANGMRTSTPDATPGASTSYNVVELFLPTDVSLPIFAAAATEQIQPVVENKYYLAPQCRDALNIYVAQQGLAINGGRSVKLDSTLSRCVLNRKERAPECEPGNTEAKTPIPVIKELERSDLVARFMSRLTPYHVVIPPGMRMVAGEPVPASVKVRKDKPRQIEIRVEKRQGSKALTTVSNLQAFQVNEKQLAETLQKSLAASASVYEDVGAAKGKDKPLAVQVQGSFADAVCDILVNKSGLPKNFISIVKKVGGV